MGSTGRLRLGKIEEYILRWGLRQHPFDEYRSKSGALLSYARWELGYKVNQLPSSVKSVLSTTDYRRLHASFSRSLRRLSGKGLLDLNNRAEVLDARSSWNGRMNPKLARRDTFYVLTVNGRRRARQILKSSSTK